MDFQNDVRVGEMRAAVVDGVDIEELFRQAVLRGDDMVSSGKAGSGQVNFS